MSDLLRVYFDPAEIGLDGYPYAWHGEKRLTASHPDIVAVARRGTAIKDLIRERDGHRCLRCGHPYRKGQHGNGEWSPCDERCTHGGPGRFRQIGPEFAWTETHDLAPLGGGVEPGWRVEAQWRILTVHHLNGVKHDCRWWNLVSLCQRCHLSIQSRVVMDRVYPFEHSEWFKPFAAGWYAYNYLGEDLTREQVDARLDELLDLERAV